MVSGMLKMHASLCLAIEEKQIDEAKIRIAAEMFKNDRLLGLGHQGSDVIQGDGFADIQGLGAVLLQK